MTPEIQTSHALSMWGSWQMINIHILNVQLIKNLITVKPV